MFQSFLLLTFLTMSDFLSPLSLQKFQNSVSFTSQQTPYHVNKQSADSTSVAVTLQLSSKFLLRLLNTSKDTGLSYITIVNSQLTFLQFLPSDRVETHLNRLCSKVYNDYKGKYRSGSKRYQYDNKLYNITIFKNELENVASLTCRISEFNHEKVELEKKCKDLFNLLLNEQNQSLDIAENLDTCLDQIDYILKRNATLTTYIDNIEKQHYSNSGKKFDDLQPRQRLRKLKTLESYAEKALSFANTFGLNPTKLDCISDAGKKVSLNLSDSPSKDSYDTLHASEKDNLRQLVFLLDKFCVSDFAYHELSMLFDNMPRKYIVSQSRNDINKIFHLERLPGNMPGAIINLDTELKRVIKQNFQNLSNVTKLDIKFSGDGARVSRISNFVIFSIQVLSSDNTCSLSCNDLNTIAVVKCSENYENLRSSCKPLFDQLSALAKEKVISVDDHNIDLDIFVGGDMKFIQILLGLGGSTGNFACPWCKVHKDNRFDTSKAWDFYHNVEMLRSIDEIVTLSSQSESQFGVKHRPLLEIDVDYYVPDELHLMLRVSDILLRNLINDCKNKDDKIRKEIKSGCKPINIDNFEDLVQSCGVVFHIWTPKGSNDLEWTSLSGGEKIKLLKYLPEKLLNSDVLNTDTKEKVVRVWQDFYAIYLFVCSKECENVTGFDIFCKIKSWMELFLSIERQGYLKCNVTPYMHCLIYHVPYFISKYGSLKRFSNQGVEKNNDVIKTIHQRKCSKWDGPSEALQVRKRLEFNHAENVARPKRQYVKKSEWWENNIFTSRHDRRKQIDDEIFAAGHVENCSSVNEIDIENLSDNDIKELIFKKKGEKTRVRNRNKLVDILKNLI